MNNSFLQFLHSAKRSPKKVLHVGANDGQEVAFYASRGIEAWHVEAIPTTYKLLEARCAVHNSQHAINACLSNEDKKRVKFHLASNSHQSSSLFQLGRHSAAYPSVTYTEDIYLVTSTIDSLVTSGLIPSDIDFLVLDVQGAELLVLQGADRLLSSAALIGCQVETAVVSLYEGGANYLDVALALKRHGFHLRNCDFNRDGWTDALFVKPYWPEALSVEDLKVLDVLRPHPSPKPLIRVGGKADGAYLLPLDLDGVSACFSPGVCNSKDFEDELLKSLGIVSHMCDFSSDVDKFKTPLIKGQTFRKLWLDTTTKLDSITLEDWVNELAPDKNDDLILQMDIEGAEYRILLGAPTATLKRFRIIVLELHELGVCNRPEDFRKELGPLLKRLGEHFICVHAHPNNCCGDFLVAGTSLNLPNVHELTFLRRDRWKGVKPEDCSSPLLPHPLDICCNVAGQAPIFLTEAWLPEAKRPPESIAKMLADEAFFAATRSDVPPTARAEEPDAASRALTEVHNVAFRVSSALPDLQQMPDESSLSDLAEGKPYRLSSSYGNLLAAGLVSEEEPFFFHTARGVHQFISIDLQSECTVFQLLLRNRSDACQSRARCLFFCVHNSFDPDFTNGFPVNSDRRFLEERNFLSCTRLRGCQGRYLTIYSPEDTYLHLSKVQVLGLAAVAQQRGL
jgi:FkbM family methyltransferase